MDKFCKIFDTRQFGQILIKLDNCNEDVDWKIICSIRVEGNIIDFKLTYNSKEEAEDLFEKTSREVAVSLVQKLLKNLVEKVEDNVL